MTVSRSSLFVLALVAAAAATPLRAQTHPRLFFDAADVAGLRTKAQSAPHSAMLAQMIKNINSVDYNLRGGNLGAAYLLTGNETYARMAALRALDYISDTTRWENNSAWGLRRGIDNVAVAHLLDLCYNSTTWAGMTVPAAVSPESFVVNGVTVQVPGTGTTTTSDGVWFTAYTGRTVTVPAKYVGLPLRTAVSQALKNNADSLMASGGGSWPGNDSTGNNWWAVRYAGAGLGYLASDEADGGKLAEAITKLKTHLSTNLGTSPLGMGWNPEGIAYAQFPGWFTYPFAIALKRAQARDLVAEHPAMRYALWSTYMGIVPIQRASRLGQGLGVKPDFDDDHNVWDGEGSAALAFAFAYNNNPNDAIADFDYRPGLKWMFRRLTGDYGDKQWDSASGNGLYAFLYYPDSSIPEQNPDTVWGRTYYDPTYGAVMFRNGHQAADFSPVSGGNFTTLSTDFVFQTTANLRSSVGGHGGPDDLTFRMIGLGVPWAVGSGRVWDIRGQSGLFPYDPETAAAAGVDAFGTEITDLFLRPNTGDGYVVARADTTSTGVGNLRRRMVVDYSGRSGAPGFFIVSDSCSETTPWWRQQTIMTNSVDVSTPRQFVITSPEGHRLLGKILYPANAQARTGTFLRGSPYSYRSMNTEDSKYNRWVDFAGAADGNVLVAMAVVPAGQSLPAINVSGNPAAGFTVTAGTAQFNLSGDAVTSPHWNPPSLNIVAPAVGQAYVAGSGGTANVTVSGTAADADGTVAKVQVFLDDVLRQTYTVSSASVNWGPLTLTGVGLGDHTVKVIATDNLGDTRTATAPISVTNSVPPAVEITHPTAASPLQAGQTVVLRGRAVDAESLLARVEIWDEIDSRSPALQRAGNATLDTANGTWSFAYPGFAVGRHTIYALAVDGAGDSTESVPVTLTGALRFSADPTAGDAGNYSRMSGLNGSSRWSVVDDNGNLVLKLRELQNYDYDWNSTFLRGSDNKQFPAFEVSWRARALDPVASDPYCFLRFGSNVYLDLQTTNGIEPPNSYTPAAAGTRVWYDTGSYHPEIAWGEGLHRTTDAGYPNNAGTDKAGIPNSGWNNLKARRVGKNLKVWANDVLILDGTDNMISTRGSIGFANERATGSSMLIDDVVYMPLHADGTSAADQPAALAFTAPADLAQTAAGANVTFTGTAADADGLTALALYRGATKVADLPVGATWAWTWTAPARGKYSFHLQSTDARGFVSRSAPRRITVAASAGSGGNLPPTVTIGQNGSVTAPNFGLTGSVADVDGSVAGVQVFRQGLLIGTATLSGGTWSLTASGIATGNYVFTARAYDDWGDYAEASFTGSVDSNAPPTISNIADQTTELNTATATLPFTIGDDATPVGSLTVTAGSSNTQLVPAGNIVLGGAGANRTVRVTPAAGVSGTCVITVTVSDGSKTGSDLFTVTVNAPPVATSIAVTPANVSVAPGAVQQFAASLNDQYGNPVSPQPAFTWNVSGGGAINANGLFTAGSSIGFWSVSATASGLTGNTVFSVATPVPSSTLVRTGFEGYPASGNVAGTAAPAVGDVGIATDTWAGTNWSWIGAGLSYSNVDGNITGGSRALDYSGSNYQFRQVNVSPQATINQTVYVRFLVKLDAAPGAGKSAGAQFVANNDLTNTNNNRYPGFGLLSANGSANDYFIRNTDGTETCFGGKAGTAVRLVVAKLTWAGTGFTRIDAWADPVYADSGAPDASINFVTPLPAISQLVFRGGSTTGGPGLIMDEFVVATGWGGVVPLPPPVATTVEVSPASITVSDGANAAFAATVFDQYGAHMSPQPAVAWSVSGGGTIAAGGQFTAGLVAGGPHLVTATAGAASGTANVTVTFNAPPTISNISNQTTQSGTATANLAFTVGDDSTPVASLTVTANSSNATLVPAGNILFGGTGANRTVRVTPAAGQTGTCVITVTVSDGSKSASDTFTLTVTSPAVATSIAVSPANASLAPGATQQFAAVLNDQYGSPMTPQPSFTWSGSGGGTINASGLLTAGSVAGSWSVTASASSLSGSAAFTVAGGVPSSTLIQTGFEGYPATGNVVGTAAPAAGDVGIATDTWAGANWSWLGSGLSYSSAGGTIAGGSRALDYTGSNYQFRQVNVSPQATINQTVHVRFLVKLDAAPGAGKNAGAQFVANNDVTNSNNNRYPGFGLFSANGSANDFFIRNTNGTETYFGGKAGTTVHLVVARLTWSGTGFTHIDAWVDPTDADSGTPDASVTFATPLPAISQLVFRGGSTTGGPGVVMDEFLVATGWGGVVPLAPPVATTVEVEPAGITVAAGANATFNATVRDQYAQPMSPQPAVSWSVSGGGTIAAGGQFTAGTVAGGPYLVTATAGAASGTANVTVQAPAGSGNPLVAYAGAAGIEEFKDVVQLSDGSVLVAGSADALTWVTANKTQLAPLTIPNRATGRTAFLLRFAPDLQTVLGAWHLPVGQAYDIRWIKTTSQPGQPTGSIYVSGRCDTTSGDYFIARLNNNFVSGNPTAFSWVKVAKASAAYGDNLGLQAWDVGGDGRIAYTHETGTALRVFFADAAGNPMKLSALRGSHWAAGAALDDANRQAGVGSTLPGTAVSGISFPADLRSWTEPERLAILPDGNGQIKRGTWPMDLFTAVQDKNGTTTGTIEYGYTGYRNVGKYRIGGIAIDRGTNDFFIGFNVQSKFWDTTNNIEQPDFEPAIIAYSGMGELKWWSRLYHEVMDANGNGAIDSGETRLSSPDQYVDGLVVDHSITPSRLVVNARAHGNNVSNLWSGHQVAAAPGVTSFQRQFTGTEGNIHLSWLGKLRADTGTLMRASYVAGYFRNTVLTQGLYTEAVHDGWPSHNMGWPDLTTTRVEPGSVRADALGRVYVVGVGPRMVTSANAYQKLPKITPSINQGISPWAAFVRVLDPDLATLVYSSALTGAWTYPSAGAEPVGANNTDLYGAFPIADGVLTVGRHRATAGVADGNGIPPSNVPAWGSATPSNVSGIFARLPFATAIGNQPPVANNDTASMNEGASLLVDVLANDTDPDSGSLAIGGFGSAGNGTVALESGALRYTPNPGFYGSDSVAYTATDGIASDGATLTLTVANTATAMDLSGLGLIGRQIGSAAAGSARVLADGSWEINGSGAGLASTADSFHAESQSVGGSFQVVARVCSLTSGGATPLAGVMVRESTAAGARTVWIALTPSAGVRYGVRSTTGAAAAVTSVSSPVLAFPNGWVMVERDGTQLTVAVSPDDITYTQIANVTLTGLATSVEAGVFASSGTIGINARAVVTDFAISPLSARLLTWANTSGDRLWNTNSVNWSGDGAIYQNGDEVTFGSTGVGNVTLTASVAPFLTRFSHPSGTYTMNGSLITDGQVVQAGGGITIFNGYVASHTFPGGTAVSLGALRYRINGTPLPANGSAVAFGTGPIALSGGGLFGFNVNNNDLVLSNDFQVAASGGTLDLSRTAGNPNSVIAGNISLGGPLSIDAGSGGAAGGTYGSHAISGSILLDQSANATVAVRRINNHANQNLVIAGAITDGTGPALNPLRLRNNVSGTLILHSPANSYSRGTVVEARTTALTDPSVTTNGYVEVAVAGSLGTGNVTVENKGYLRLRAAGNVAPAATLTIATGGAAYVDTGVTVTVRRLTLGSTTHTSGTFNSGSAAGSIYGAGQIQVVP